MISPTNKEENIPKVEFKDGEVLELVGNWICQNSDEKRYKNDIEKQFGYLLKLTGIDSTETCIINHVRSYLFNCYLKGAKDEARIKLFNGDNEDCAEFEINYNDMVQKRFFYHPAHNNGEVLFKPNIYTIKNQNNENTLIRNFDVYRSSFAISNGEYNFSLVVADKFGNKKSHNEARNYVSVVPNEQAVMDYLLDLSFPCTIEEVYKKINRLSLKDIKSFPHVVLKIEKKGKKTDAIELVDGAWAEFTRTNNGETVSLDNKGVFTYRDRLVALEEGMLTIHTPVKQISEDMLISPIKELQKIEKEVQKVKRIAKNTFSSK